MRHDRTPGDPSDDYLVAPVPQIGRVISASTNRSRNGFHPPTRQDKQTRNGIVLLIAIFGAVGSLFFGSAIHTALMNMGVWQVAQYGSAFTLGFGAIGTVLCVVLGIVLSLVLRRPRATWVGEQGVQRYIRGAFFGPKLEGVSWDQANGLVVSRTRQFVNGVYTGTHYSYGWRDGAGKVLFQIAGQYNDLQPPAPSDDVAFALAAEESWTRHRIGRMAPAIVSGGTARFACGRSWIAVGRGFIEIGDGSSSERLTPQDISRAHFDRGTLTIAKVGARQGWFSSDGVFRFQAGGISDLRVFLILLENEAGVRLG
jgi:hypothetical protein